MTLYIYAARPKQRALDFYRYVGYASTTTTSGPSDAFHSALHRLRRSRHIPARRLAMQLPRAADWSVEILEVDEAFVGTRGEMEERRAFYLYWLRHEHECILLNSREPLALDPTWTRTWSVLDNAWMF